MKLWVKLIEVNGTDNQEARKCLQDKCTHVDSCYWLFHGEETELHEGIDFVHVGEENLPHIGALTSDQLITLVTQVYNTDPRLCSEENRLRGNLDHLYNKNNELTHENEQLKATLKDVKNCLLCAPITNHFTVVERSLAIMLEQDV